MNELDTDDLPDETIEAMKAFGAVLQRIHDRLVSEGKRVEIDEHYCTENKPKN